MAKYGRWETMKELGRGGQGVVYLAYDTQRFDEDKWVGDITRILQTIGSITTPEVRAGAAKELPEILRAYQSRWEVSSLGALKVLHRLGPSADLDKARTRMAGEVGALLNISHPNLLRILDANLKEDWFVCEYHPAGPLSNYPELFKGDIVGALKAFRPIVEGVAKLHQAGLIHRDIKPANVFLASGSRLVLGDMGLAFRDQQERATETYENVGSRDWMPPWAMGMRLQDVRPCFDVFSLGKLFWFMVSGKGILRLWYYDRPEFNLEVQFPDDERMRWVNRLLTGCIREEPQYCWQSATQLLEHIDKFLDILRRGGEILRGDIRRHCRVCGVGVYTMIVNERMGPSAIRNFGLQAVGDPRWRIFQCGFCGHIQMFQLNGSNPAAWQE